MDTTHQLMSGYAAYTDGTEIAIDSSAEAPAFSPFVTSAFSPLCPIIIPPNTVASGC